MSEYKYTTELYARFEECVSLIGEAFFTSKGKHAFPKIVLAINNRVSSCVVAFVQADALYDTGSKEKVQYLGINPYYLDRTVPEVLATLCHELCHVYENAYIHIPRGGYHDKQWAELMRDCGLEPKFLNKSKTAVSHTIIEGGAFDKFVTSFLEKHGEDYFHICSYSRLLEVRPSAVQGGGEDGEPRADNADKPVKKYNRNKVKYTCPDCGAKVWGKAGLGIECMNCASQFEEEE